VAFTFSHLPFTPIFALAPSADSTTVRRAFAFSVFTIEADVEAVLYTFVPFAFTTTWTFIGSGGGTGAGGWVGQPEQAQEEWLDQLEQV